MRIIARCHCTTPTKLKAHNLLICHIDLCPAEPRLIFFFENTEDHDHLIRIYIVFHVDRKIHAYNWNAAG